MLETPKKFTDNQPPATVELPMEFAPCTQGVDLINQLSGRFGPGRVNELFQTSGRTFDKVRTGLSIPSEQAVEDLRRTYDTSRTNDLNAVGREMPGAGAIDDKFTRPSTHSPDATALTENFLAAHSITYNGEPALELQSEQALRETAVEIIKTVRGKSVRKAQELPGKTLKEAHEAKPDVTEAARDILIATGGPLIDRMGKLFKNLDYDIRSEFAPPTGHTKATGFLIRDHAPARSVVPSDKEARATYILAPFDAKVHNVLHDHIRGAAAAMKALSAGEAASLKQGIIADIQKIVDDYPREIADYAARDDVKAWVTEQLIKAGFEVAEREIVEPAVQLTQRPLRVNGSSKAAK